MRLFIQNMVSLRCKLFVKSVLENLGIKYQLVVLGEVEITGLLSERKRTLLKSTLHTAGLELMDDKKAVMLEKVKRIVVEMVHYTEELPDIKFSEYLQKKMDIDYNVLSLVFSQTKGVTIEQYIQVHKIEKVKELLIYSDFSLSQIADKLNYSSTAHLSNQFKRITGLTPTYFKSLKIKRNTKRDQM